MGLRVINIADPYHPVSAGYYSYDIDDTIPGFAGCDTYDVIFGPHDYLYVFDGSSGLRVLKTQG